MKEILSQSEIDKLLNAVSSGELHVDELIEKNEKKPIKSYDFKRPNKFSKDHLRTLQMIHDNFARICSNFLSGFLRANIQVKVVSVDQMTYEDFIRSVPSPTLMSIFSIEPLKGVAILETNSNFLFPVIDLLFGGPGEHPKEVRELTDIELSVLRKLNSKIIENLTLAWSNIFEIKPQLQSLETNPRFNHSVTPNETVALITMDTLVGENKGLINLCLPFVTLDPLISRLSSHHWFTHQKMQDTDTDKSNLEYILNNAPVKIKAVFGEVTFTVQDFLHLQEGDIIKLDRFIDEELDMFVEDELKFKIQPGLTSNNRIGVQITRLVEKGEDEYGE